jgi:hypothetical protein
VPGSANNLSKSIRKATYYLHLRRSFCVRIISIEGRRSGDILLRYIGKEANRWEERSFFGEIASADRIWYG